MSDPIADILSAMRVQRMSLVQSLRQYLFVHRVVIAHYLRMIDREAKGASLETNRSADTHRTSSGDLERLSMGSGTSFLAPSTAPTSISGTDDEAHIKRKPSSTDLQPEQDIRLQLSSNKVDELRLNDEGSNLSKRLSFKKRRGETAPP
jgi:protein-tyrosine phosphatase